MNGRGPWTCQRTNDDTNASFSVQLQKWTLTAGDGSTVATVKTDATGSYKFKGLADGTYTVTPTKAGKVFTPANRTATVSGANATAKKFTGKKAS